jgi:hypothetical protein
VLEQMRRIAVVVAVFAVACSGSPSHGSDAPTCPAAGDGVAVGTPAVVATGPRRVAGVGGLAIATDGSGALLAIIDDSGAIGARRLRASGGPVEVDERIDVAMGPVAADEVQAVGRPGGGFVVAWHGASSGAAWLDPDGTVALRQSFSADAIVLLAWVGDHAAVITRACGGTDCVLSRVDLAAAGTVSAPVELVHVPAATIPVHGALDSNGGVLAWGSSDANGGRVIRGLDLDGTGAAAGAARDLVADPALPDAVVAVANTPAGGHGLLACTTMFRGASCQHVAIDAAGTATAGPALALDFLPSSLVAVTSGFVSVGAATTGTGFGTQIMEVDLDAAGAAGAERTLAASVWPDTRSGFAGAVALDGDNVLAASVILDPSSLPTRIQADVIAGSGGTTTTAWSLEARYPLTVTDVVIGPAGGTYVVFDGTAVRADVPGSTPFALPGAQTDVGPATVRLIGTPDALWAVSLDLYGNAQLASLDASGSVESMHALDWQVGDRLAPLAAATTDTGVALAGPASVLRLGASGSPAGAPISVDVGPGPRRLVAAPDGALLLLASDGGPLHAARIGSAGDVVVSAIPDVAGPLASVDAWTCGPSCWIVVSSQHSYRFTGTWHELPLVLPAGVTALAASSEGCDALVAVRTADDALDVMRVDARAAAGLGPPISVGTTAASGFVLAPGGRGRFAVATSGTQIGVVDLELLP